eukprot:3902622-Amphidinium_carterae.1
MYGVAGNAFERKHATTDENQTFACESWEQPDEGLNCAGQDFKLSTCQLGASEPGEFLCQIEQFLSNAMITAGSGHLRAQMQQQQQQQP